MPSGHNVQQLVTASTDASGPLPVEGLNWQLGPKTGAVVVVQGSAAVATLTVEGRITPTGPWVSLATSTGLSGGAGAVAIPIPNALPEMRLNWTVNAGTINAWGMA